MERLTDRLLADWEDWASVAIFLVAPVVAVTLFYLVAGDGY
jgi:hypothetical protein